MINKQDKAEIRRSLDAINDDSDRAKAFTESLVSRAYLMGQRSIAKPEVEICNPTGCRGKWPEVEL